MGLLLNTFKILSRNQYTEKKHSYNLPQKNNCSNIVKTLPSKLIGEIEYLQFFNSYYTKYKDYLDGFLNNILPYLEENEYDKNFNMLQKTLEKREWPHDLSVKFFLQYKLIDGNLSKRINNVYYRSGSKIKTPDKFICDYIDIIDRDVILLDINIAILCAYLQNSGYNLKIHEIYNKLTDFITNGYQCSNKNYKETDDNEQENDSESLKNFENMLLNKNTSSITMEDIDKMTGYDFEDKLKELFKKIGFNAIVTKKSGDQGADLILTKSGERIAVQAKRYSGNVSNSAVQEIVAAKLYYRCQKTMIVTNSYFTDAAINLAKVNEVQLIDRNNLHELIRLYF
ncbi:restriction endonuclease [Clostridium cadaveris]|uniref:restriction endonuclease n=1 Tax=Clostridium cadaveris TaxID=1529 RepID=UPI0039931929